MSGQKFVRLLEMVVYSGPVEDSHQLIQFFRVEARKLRILRKMIVSEEKTVVLDVNRDYQPWLIERARLFAAMDTWDGKKKRGLLLIE